MNKKDSLIVALVVHNPFSKPITATSINIEKAT